MKYLKNLVFSFKEIIVVYLFQYIIAIGTTYLYYLLKGNNINKFITNILPFILMIYYFIVIAIVLYKSKPEINKLKIKNVYTISILGISIAIIINLIYFKLGIVNSESSLGIITLIVSSGLLGPIFEELIFRKIFLNKLLMFNKPVKSIIINTSVFALIHGSINSIIYAFILGILFNMVYLRYKNIWASIIMHISANVVVLFLSGFNISLIILSIITLILSMYLVLRKYKANIIIN